MRRKVPAPFSRQALRRPISAIAGDLGVTQPLHRILAEEAAITPATALRLGKFRGNGPDPWLRIEQAHELWHAQKVLQKQLNKTPAAGEDA